MEPIQPAGPVTSGVPAPVQAALAREADHVDTVQQQPGSGPSAYQATVSKGGKPYKLDIAKDGTVVKRQRAEGGD